MCVSSCCFAGIKANGVPRKEHVILCSILMSVPVDLGEQDSHGDELCPIHTPSDRWKTNIPAGSLDEEPAGTYDNWSGYFTLILPLITTWMLQK